MVTHQSTTDASAALEAIARAARRVLNSDSQDHERQTIEAK
jgi:hypothetical protein